MLTKGAWAFDTRANAIATYQMMQQYDQITFKFKRPNSLIYLSSVRHEGLLFLPSVLYFQQAKTEGQQKPYVEEDDIKRLSSSLITG